MQLVFVACHKRVVRRRTVLFLSTLVVIPQNTNCNCHVCFPYDLTTEIRSHVNLIKVFSVPLFDFLNCQ